jgi:hypothetical protein
MLTLMTARQVGRTVGCGLVGIPAVGSIGLAAAKVTRRNGMGARVPKRAVSDVCVLWALVGGFACPSMLGDDPCSEEFALIKDRLEGTGEAADDQRGRVGARDDDGLFVECGEDVLRQSFGRPRCLRPYQGDQSAPSGFADLGRGTELIQQPEHGRAAGC